MDGRIIDLFDCWKIKRKKFKSKGRSLDNNLILQFEREEYIMDFDHDDIGIDKFNIKRGFLSKV